MVDLTEADVAVILARWVREAGSMRALAREWGCSVAYISDAMNGRRAPGPKILGPMGIERVKVVVYRRIKLKERRR